MHRSSIAGRRRGMDDDEGVAPPRGDHKGSAHFRSDDDDAQGEETHESHKQRLDRELIELLNGLRIALPGVQVLFAFLLTVPFSQRFERLTSFDRGVYFVSLLSAAVSSAMFIAPSAYHRLRFRRGDKERLIQTANHQAIA